MGKKKIPEFTNCVEDENGEIWCFDKAAECICRVIPVYTTVPEKVYLELLTAANKKDE